MPIASAPLFAAAVEDSTNTAPSDARQRNEPRAAPARAYAFSIGEDELNARANALRDALDSIRTDAKSGRATVVKARSVYCESWNSFGTSIPCSR